MDNVCCRWNLLHTDRSHQQGVTVDDADLAAGYNRILYCDRYGVRVRLRYQPVVRLACVGLFQYALKFDGTDMSAV